MNNSEGRKITIDQEVDDELATFNLREFLDVNELTLEPVPLEKILFTGLDDSGKTSIILAIQRELSLISLLKPTRHAQRKIFQYMDRKISEWDLGGQKRYRIAYLREPTKYFAGTSVCIYTIDMQDKRRIHESLSYLGDVVEQFKKLGIAPMIYIFFHKLDPDYTKEQGVHLTGFISELKDNIRKIVKDEFSVVFMQTSIYDLWTIISSFSRILLQLYPQSELLDKTITQFVEKIHSKGALVLDSNSLVIAQHFEDDVVRQILQNSTAYFLTLAESLTRTDQTFREMNITRGNHVFFIGEFSIPKSAEPLYIILMKEKTQPEFSAEEFDAFVKMLQTIL